MEPFDDQTRLVQAAFDAATSGQWTGLLNTLLSVTAADDAGVWVGAEAEGRREWTTGAPLGLPGHVRATLRSTRLYGGDDLPADAQIDGFLRLLVMRDRAAPEVGLWIRRGAHRKEFRAVDGTLMLALAPFMPRAGAAFVHSAERRTDSRVAQIVARDEGNGWILFDRSGMILRLSDMAKEWAVQVGQTLEMGRRADWGSPERAHQLRQAFGAVLAGQAAPIVLLSAEPAVHGRLEPDPHGILLRMRRAPCVRAWRPSALARALGLSPSEARLAACLADGLSLREAALALAWTEETARSTSKAIYARMGVSGQVGLVRAILTMPALSLE